MKKIIKLLVLMLIVILPINVKAMSVDKNNLTIETGKSETIGIYAEVDTEVTEIQFTMVYTTYDVPAYFNIESGLTDTNPNGISHKIIFSNPVSGKIKLGTIKTNVVNNPKVIAGTINIHSAKAITSNNETINLNAQTINVTIGKEMPKEEIEPDNNLDKETNNTNNNNNTDNNKETPKKEEVNKKEETKTENKKTNLLKNIESEIVKINLKENVYEYKVNIKEDIEELDLKPIAKEENYKVEVSSQKISELKDNKIIITVKDGDNSEEYIIKVNRLNKVEKIEIDEEEFESTYKYKGKWITMIVVLSGVLFVGLLLTKKK